MHKVYYFLLIVMFGCISCEWQFSMDEDVEVVVDRYDRIQSLYLTTGDFSALQQMNTVYPMQTRTLIEDVLRIGKVDDQLISKKFLRFYQDSTLQIIIAEAEQQYANMDDINADLTTGFKYLRENLPGFEVPEVYAQIGSLDQSVIVGNNSIGICLDKYLGTDYPLYQKPQYGYSKSQLELMNRQYIVPDCVAFYLLRHYPMPIEGDDTTHLKRTHMARIQYVVNQVTDSRVFSNDEVSEVEKYMTSHPEVSIKQLLSAKNNQ